MREGTHVEEPRPAVPDTRDETRTIAPPVDIFEVEDGLAVVVDLPGVDKEDLKIDIEQNILTISARSKANGFTEDKLVSREYELHNYFRQFQLSEQVDRDNISAEMKYGVLTLRMPKAEAAKPKRIDVRVTGASSTGKSQGRKKS